MKRKERRALYAMGQASAKAPRQQNVQDMSCCQDEGQPQTGAGPRPTPWSSHTCTEAKSPEAQAPRTAAPTRTDSTSCDRTTGMPVQNKATPWLGSRARGASQQPQQHKHLM